MAENKKNTPESAGSGSLDSKGKKPKFSFNLYWIYGLILLIFIGMQLFSSYEAGLQRTDSNSLYEWMQEGDVKEITIVNESFAEITLTEEALKKDKFREVREKSFGRPNVGPHYQCPIRPSSFDDVVNELRKSNPQ